MDQTREQNAVNAYYKLLRSKGADDACIRHRAVMLDEFAPMLADKELVGAIYRDVAEHYLETQAADLWPAYLTIIREFFPIWRSDIKAISVYASEVGYELNLDTWIPAPIIMQEEWQSITEEKFSTAESWALKSYIKAMKDLDGAEDVIEVRTKMVKILLKRLREAPLQQKNPYRIAVDATTPLFEQKNSRKLFMIVVREFFHFWSGNPEAKEMVFKNTKASVV